MRGTVSCHPPFVFALLMSCRHFAPCVPCLSSVKMIELSVAGQGREGKTCKVGCLHG